MYSCYNHVMHALNPESLDISQRLTEFVSLAHLAQSCVSTVKSGASRRYQSATVGSRTGPDAPCFSFHATIWLVLAWWAGTSQLICVVP